MRRLPVGDHGCYAAKDEEQPRRAKDEHCRIEVDPASGVYLPYRSEQRKR
jgi:hypothetical protein